VLSAGSAGNPSCSPYVCSGASATCPISCTGDGNCTSGYYCSASACVAKKPNGATCGAASECTSGNCVDGYCCNTACGASCDACNLSGSLGTCTNLAAGSAGSPSCSPYVCSGASATCPISCTGDGNCTSGYYCSASVCVAKKSNGQTCSAANQCTSGNCVDGYCCNTACGASCDACNLSGSLGTCTNVTAGSAGSPSCSPYVCSGASATCPVSCTGDGNCAAGYTCTGAICARVFTIDAFQRGWWDAAGNHTSANDNTYTGNISGGGYNSYFSFNLAGVTGTVISAQLQLELEAWFSPDASETCSIWDVATSCPSLEADGTNPTIYNDLQSGVQYGSNTFLSTGVGTVYPIALNAQGISNIQAALGGCFSTGVHVSTLTWPSGNEGLRFSMGSEARIHRLVVTTQ
jgi:hypothetical protein